MIIALDTETRGLDATKFILGVIVKDKQKNPIIYHDKKQMWKDILELGYKEFKRGKMLNVYAHNHEFDFYGYADLKDKGIKFHSNKPFIVSYSIPIEKEIEFKTEKVKQLFYNKILNDPNFQLIKEDKLKVWYSEKKEIIKFLDTLSIFKMTLEEAGEIIGFKKIKTPEYLKNPALMDELLKTEKMSEFELMNQIQSYCVRDTEIVLKLVKYIKKKLEKENINLKRIMTINQIAIAYVLKKLKVVEMKNKSKIIKGKEIFYNELFEDIEKEKIWKTKYRHLLHGAYRGGRVEAWKTGTIDKVSYIDCNSLYPFAQTKIDFPDLTTERLIKDPLKLYSQNTLFNKIGFSKCLIYNKSNDYGLLPIRTNAGNYFPKSKKYLIGTWTHIELKEAIEEGYEIKKIEWSVLYKKASKNPFREIVPQMYKLKEKARGDKFEYWYRKMMTNASIGKFGQSRAGQEFIIDDYKHAEAYINAKYEIIKAIDDEKRGDKYMFQKTDKFVKLKKYYCPIIPTLTNAYARVYMYQQFKKIPLKDLIYTDTDSIIFKGNHLNKFKISQKLGDFKIEKNKEGKEYINVQCIIYGRKTYAIGDEMKISGFKQRNLTLKQFTKGVVTSMKMNTIRNSKDINKLGTFKEETRNLTNQLINFKKMKEILDNELILLDSDCKDLNSFVDEISFIV